VKFLMDFWAENFNENESGWNEQWILNKFYIHNYTYHGRNSNGRLNSRIGELINFGIKKSSWKVTGKEAERPLNISDFDFSLDMHKTNRKMRGCTLLWWSSALHSDILRPWQQKQAKIYATLKLFEMIFPFETRL
jgi:hypothetical protein